MKKINLILAIIILTVLSSCSPEDAPAKPTVCVMHQIAQEATVDGNVGGAVANATWRQMNAKDADVFYSNVCTDEGKITYTNSVRFTQNGNPNWLYLRRNIILRK
jgi:accessory colonization factor AcfC